MAWVTEEQKQAAKIIRERLHAYGVPIKSIKWVPQPGFPWGILHIRLRADATAWHRDMTKQIAERYTQGKAWVMIGQEKWYEVRRGAPPSPPKKIPGMYRLPAASRDIKKFLQELVEHLKHGYYGAMHLAEDETVEIGRRIYAYGRAAEVAELLWLLTRDDKWADLSYDSIEKARDLWRRLE